MVLDFFKFMEVLGSCVFGFVEILGSFRKFLEALEAFGSFWKFFGSLLKFSEVF